MITHTKIKENMKSSGSGGQLLVAAYGVADLLLLVFEYVSNYVERIQDSIM